MFVTCENECHAHNIRPPRPKLPPALRCWSRIRNTDSEWCGSAWPVAVPRQRPSSPAGSPPRRAAAASPPSWGTWPTPPRCSLDTLLDSLWNARRYRACRCTRRRWGSFAGASFAFELEIGHTLVCWLMVASWDELTLLLLISAPTHEDCAATRPREISPAQESRRKKFMVAIVLWGPEESKRKMTHSP